MSKFAKGIGKAVKNILKGLKKGFKAVFKSPVGKILLIAAAVYSGGVALGAWGGAAGATGAASAAGAAGATGGTAAAGATGAGAATTAGVGSGITTGLGATGISTGVGTGVASTGAAGALSSLTPATQGFLSTAGSGLLSAGKGLATYAEANPLLASVALQGLSGALASDPAEEEAKRRRQQYSTLTDASKIKINNRYDAKGAIGGAGYLQ